MLSKINHLIFSIIISSVLLSAQLSSVAASPTPADSCQINKKSMLRAIRESNPQQALASFETAIDQGMMINDKACIIVAIVGYYGYTNKIGDPYAAQLKDIVLNFTVEEYQVWNADADLRSTLAFIKLPEQVLNPPKEPEIFTALRNRDHARIQELIKDPAQRNAVDVAGLSLMHYAAGANMVELVTQLISLGTDVDIKDKLGRTPLCEAAYQGSTDIVTLLLKGGANPNIIDANGGTPLIFAALGNHVAVGEAIINAGANINTPDGTGNTALILATYKGNNDFVVMLLKNNADVTIKNAQGSDVMDIAIYAKRDFIIEKLAEIQK